MGLTAELAERAGRALQGDDADHLRMLTATNMAAALGDLGRVGPLVDRLPFPPDRAPGAAARAAIVLHARTQDDFYPLGRVHVGAITLAVALALAEEVGDRLLESLAAGYDVMGVVSEALSGPAQERGLRPSGIFGPLGAAATAATALGLGTDGVANALGLAAAMAGGTNQAWLSGTDEWMLVVAQAARLGVEAALLTQAGVRASDTALEGDAGWGAAYFGDRGLATVRAALDDERARIGVVASKLYPVSGIAQLSAHLACAAHAEGPTPRTIQVRIPVLASRYPGTLHPGPFRSRSDALMSVPFVVACGVTHGVIRLHHLETPGAAGVDAALAAVEVVADPALADEATVLVLARGDGPAVESALDDERLLHPTWDELRAAPDPLAVRTEADPAAIGRTLDALAAAHPDARPLRRLLEETS